jgi:hypothetical protein
MKIAEIHLGKIRLYRYHLTSQVIVVQVIQWIHLYGWMSFYKWFIHRGIPV